MLRTNVHQLATNGIKENRKKTFTFELTGEQVYVLTGLLKQTAVQSTNYLDVANAVQVCEAIEEQIREQGF